MSVGVSRQYMITIFLCKCIFHGLWIFLYIRLSGTLTSHFLMYNETKLYKHTTVAFMITMPNGKLWQKQIIYYILHV